MRQEIYMAREIETKCIHLEEEENSINHYGAISYPIYQSATYAHPGVGQSTGYDYSRLQNPTREHLEKTVASLENGIDALAFSSGMAAITLMMELFKLGDHLIVDADLYGGSIRLFNHVSEKNGIEFSSVDCHKENVAAYIRENTKAVYIETPTNPMMNVTDIKALAEITKKHNILLIVDNTFATPINCRPFEWGADIVVHSTTKYMDGHATSVGGAIVDSGNFDWDAHADKFPGLCTPDESYHGLTYTKAFGKMAYITKATAQLMRDLGSIQSPQNAFLLNLGLETLHLRMPQHCKNAQAVAEYLAQNDKVAWVNYCGLPGDKYYEQAQKYMPNGSCGVVTFGLKGGREESIKFMDSLKLAAIVTHVADARTCVLHPASHTHRQLTDEQLMEAGVRPDLIRFSVGIENAEDIIADIEQALNA